MPDEPGILVVSGRQDIDAVAMIYLDVHMAVQHMCRLAVLLSCPAEHMACAAGNKQLHGGEHLRCMRPATRHKAGTASIAVGCAGRARAMCPAL